MFVILIIFSYFLFQAEVEGKIYYKNLNTKNEYITMPRVRENN